MNNYTENAHVSDVIMYQENENTGVAIAEENENTGVAISEEDQKNEYEETISIDNLKQFIRRIKLLPPLPINFDNKSLDLINSNEENKAIREMIDNKLNIAIKILYICSVYSNIKADITTCSYTAPALGIIIIILDHYNITNFENLQNNPITVTKDGTCITLDIIELCKSINHCTGYLFNKHSNYGVGLHAAIMNNSTIFETKLSEKANIIGFYGFRDGQFQGSYHFSFIYVIGEICFIIDSWIECVMSKMVSRPPIIRAHLKSEIVSVLDEINSNNVTSERVTEIMQIYFIAPTNGSYDNSFKVFSVNPNYIESIAKHGFYESCESIKRPWSGGYKKLRKSNKRKSNKRKSNKRKSNKRKSNKRKSNKYKRIK
jgi:hypothetical protein